MSWGMRSGLYVFPKLEPLACFEKLNLIDSPNSGWIGVLQTKFNSRGWVI